MIERLLLAFPLIALCGCMSSPVATPAAPSMAGGQSALAAGQLWMAKGPAGTIPAPASAKGPKFLLNFVAAGAPLGNIPCFSCVNGTEAGTLGIPVPDNDVPPDTSWDYFMSFTSVSYTGKCKLAWSITSGKKVIDKFSGPATLGSTGPYFYGTSRNRPGYSGSAVLTGKVTCGGKSQTTTAPMTFQ
jgi:hypothetical protein